MDVGTGRRVLGSEIDGRTAALTVTLRDATGAALWSTVLPPEGERR